MRKILLSFLMLIMLTPSLACAMPVCAAPAAAAKAQCAAHAEHMSMAHNADAGEDHGGMNHNSHAGKQEKQSSSGMLMKDCMGVELQKADNSPSIYKPDISKDAPVILAFNVQPVSVWTLDDVRGIRGPPPEWPSHSQTKPSIILTTQRLRI